MQAIALLAQSGKSIVFEGLDPYILFIYIYCQQMKKENLFQRVSLVVYSEAKSSKCFAFS